MYILHDKRAIFTEDIFVYIFGMEGTCNYGGSSKVFPLSNKCVVNM